MTETGQNVMMQLREEAALQPEGSRAKRLLTWAEIHFGDTYERICELEECLEAANKEGEELREALCHIKATLEAVAGFAHAKAFKFPADAFSRDLVGHINLMAAHGDPDYLKSNGMSVRHVDTRSTPPRKKKGGDAHA